MPEAEIWTIKAALDWTVGFLSRKGDEHARLSAEWLLAEACGMRRVELYVNFDRPLSPDERARLRDWVTRRAAGEPLQYITGETAFRHIAVKVRPGVLIPRPETEVLVSEALAMLPAPSRRRAIDSRMTEEESAEAFARIAEREAADRLGDGEGDQAPFDASSAGRPSGEGGRAPAPDVDADSADAGERAAGFEPEAPLYVADICTGTGCIACSIAQENPRTRVLACDISPEAVALAKDNVAALGLEGRVAVLRGNLGEPVVPRFLGALDLVVSNPPYVPTAVLAGIPREVADFEPALALDGGADGLDLFRPLAAWAARALKPGGGFAVELHETHLDAAADIARAEGFSDVRIAADLAGRPRILAARLPLASAMSEGMRL